MHRRACQVACKNWNRFRPPSSRLRQLSTHEDTDDDTFTIVLMNEVDNAATWIELCPVHALFYAACMKACPEGLIPRLPRAPPFMILTSIGCRIKSILSLGVPWHRKREDKITKCTLCADRHWRPGCGLRTPELLPLWGTG